jgi:hypothetical protein
MQTEFAAEVAETNSSDANGNGDDSGTWEIQGRPGATCTYAPLRFVLVAVPGT